MENWVNYFGKRKKGWWGEGEVKFYIDGDTEFPTICGTGEEDYFNGSYNYKDYVVDGKKYYTKFSSLYSGFYPIETEEFDDLIDAVGQYRWHILDPVRFKKDLKITVQSLGWNEDRSYVPLQDDLASVAYWYQMEPHNSFPKLPSKENLVLKERKK